MKSTIFAIFMSTFFASQAHAQLDDYKYVVVPKQFDVFLKENQYQTSTLVKYLLTKNGFTAVYDDAYPDDLNSNRCLGLYVSLVDNSSMFMTKTLLILKDCVGREVFITQEGKSKNKEFKAAYHEAITEAFESFATLKYQYSGRGQKPGPVTISFKNDVKKLEESNVDSVSRSAKKKRAILVQEATKERQTFKSAEPVPSDYGKGNDTIKSGEGQLSGLGKTAGIANDEKPKGEPKSVKKMADVGILYAQEIPNGYQLVDSTPAIRLKMFKTTMPDVYTVVGDQVNGLVYRKDNKWFLEYYEGDTLTMEELTIKF